MEPSNNRWHNSEHRHNKAAWDRLALQRNRLARPAREIDFADPLASVDGPGWLGGDISGKRVLCLAAGGGRQGPIYAAAGASVTVVDLSPRMLDLDRQVAAKRKLNIRTLETSMDDLSALGPATFDIVIHPVSTCYIRNVAQTYREVARVLIVGGLYISQHKQPTSLQTSLQPDQGAYRIETSCFLDQPLPPSPTANLVRETGTLEYVHRWEVLLGQMCRAGLFIEDLSEPLHATPNASVGSFEHRSQFVPPYVRVKARKNETPRSNAAVFQADL